jgi:phage-related minor tail protein
MAKKKRKRRKKKQRTEKKKGEQSERILSDQFVTLDALYTAYRKAKVDVFYERSSVCHVEFAEFETNLG